MPFICPFVSRTRALCFAITKRLIKLHAVLFGLRRSLEERLVGSFELDAVVHSALFENVAESLTNGDVGFALGAVDEFRQGVAARSAFETLSGGHHWWRVERRSNGGGWRRRRGVSRGSGGSGGGSSGGSGSLVRSPGCESVADNVTYR